MRREGDFSLPKTTTTTTYRIPLSLRYKTVTNVLPKMTEVTMVDLSLRRVLLVAMVT